MSEVVCAKGLTKSYPGRMAVDRIDFSIRAGECFGILGPNGAGKSTTLRMVIGLTQLDGGTLDVFGQSMYPEHPTIPARMGVVPQEDNLDPDLTVRENLLVFGRYFGLSDLEIGQKMDRLLDFAQLEDRQNAMVRELSGGMMRRLVIARSLIGSPDLIVLDEPTTGLDPQARHLIWQRLRTLREQGVTLLLTTHYMEEAAQLCDRLLILNRGQILDHGTPVELIRRHVEPEVVELRADGVLPELQEFDHLPGRVELIGDTLFFYSSDARSILNNFRDRHDLVTLMRPANLEDVFLKLTGRELND
ncbi:MAG: ATP-binding cassette domain-containing protein [Magnetococcales bacterium]|nr:ATP-binding cassette domain-containing protein [Magnetococcales bacterium]